MSALFGVIALCTNFHGKLDARAMLILGGILISPLVAAFCQHYLAKKSSDEFKSQIYKANSNIRFDDIYGVIEFEVTHLEPYTDPVFACSNWTLNLRVRCGSDSNNDGDEILLTSTSSDVQENIPPFNGRYESNRRLCAVRFREWVGDFGDLKYLSSWNGAIVKPDVQTGHGVFHFHANRFENVINEDQLRFEVDEGIGLVGRDLADKYRREHFGEDAKEDEWDLTVEMFPVTIKISVYVDNRKVGESSGHLYYVDSTILGHRDAQTDHGQFVVNEEMFKVGR